MKTYIFIHSKDKGNDIISKSGRSEDLARKELIANGYDPNRLFSRGLHPIKSSSNLDEK